MKRLRFLLFIAFVSILLPIYAKELKVKSFSVINGDREAIDAPRVDFNGDECALLKVEVPLKDCKISGAVGDIIYQNGTYYVYLSPGVRRLTINCPDHDNLSVEFHSISDIVGLKSGHTYLLTLLSHDNSEVMDLRIFDEERRGIRVDSIEVLPFDISARTNERKDENGERCALIKVSLPIPGCSFSGNVGPVKYNVNEYDVYLSPSADNFSIKCPGFENYTVSIVDFLNGEKLKSASTYRLAVSGVDTSFIRFTPEFTSLLEKYEDVQNFKEGFAIVKNNGKYGCITVEGVEIVPCIYDELHNHHKGLAVVKRNGKYGLIDLNGEEIVPCNYDGFFNSKSHYEKKDNSYITNTSLYLSHYGYRVEFINNFLGFFRDGKRGFINVDGEEIYPLDKYDWYSPGTDGFGEVRLNNKYGLLDIHGNEIVPCEYDGIRMDGKLPKNAIARLTTSPRTTIARQRKNGISKTYINRHGNKIMPGIYGFEYEFDENGLAEVELNGKYGLINRSGQLVAPCIYSIIHEFRDGMASAVKGPLLQPSSHIGMLDTLGREIIPFVYDYNTHIYFYGDGLADVKKDGKYGIINKNGKEIVPYRYDYIERMRIINMDHNGNGVRSKSESNLFIAASNKKYGLINQKGEQIVPYQI